MDANAVNTDGLRELLQPAFKLRWDGERAAYFVNTPGIGNTDVYTADQMRAYAKPYADRLAAVEAELAALRAGIAAAPVVTAGVCELEHGEYCTEVWSSVPIDTERNKYRLLPDSGEVQPPHDDGEGK